MSSAQICLRELHQAIPHARSPTLLCDRRGNERRARDVSVKRRVLHRGALAKLVVLTTVQPKLLRARSS